MRRKGNARTAEFEGALAAARSNPEAPQPFCIGKAAVYVDYDAPPPPEEQRALCEPCELFEACDRNADKMEPVWGIHAGRHWESGKIAS